MTTTLMMFGAIYALLGLSVLIICLIYDHTNVDDYTPSDWCVMWLCAVAWPMTLLVFAMEYFDANDPFDKE